MRSWACKTSSDQPLIRIAASDLDKLMMTLEVGPVILEERLVSPGSGISIPPNAMPGIHYNMIGTSYLTVGCGGPITLVPHTLVIIPPHQPSRIDGPVNSGGGQVFATLDSRLSPAQTLAGIQRNVAGEGEATASLVQGYFRASYGASIDLFSQISCPIVERFDAADRLAETFKVALAELFAQETGTGAMTSALLKQVLVTLLRRSLVSPDVWVERFSVLADPQIARAFSDMVSRPGAPHCVETLSRTACLSRSLFMERFATIFGRPPMAILRELRMRQAAALLNSNRLTVNQVAHRIGYRSRSSFLRTFRKAYGKDWMPGRLAGSESSITLADRKSAVSNPSANLSYTGARIC